MWTWTESKLKYTSQAFREGIMSRNPSLFGPLIKSSKLDWNPTCNRILYCYTIDSNTHILSLRHQNHEIQKPKLIYTYKTTTVMKDAMLDKMFLKAKI